MSFEALTFTNAGKALLLRALAGELLTFTQIKVGDGTIRQDDIPNLTDLVDTVKAMTINSCQILEDRCSIEVFFRNDEIPRSFYYRELGVFAADPDYPDDRTKDILYVYQNAYDTAEYISISSGEIIEKVIRVNAFIGQAESVSAVIDSSTVFVTKGELKTAINQVNEDEISDDYIESLFADTNIGGSGNTPSASGGVTKAYVDAQDSKVLATALARIEGTDSTSQQDGNVITNSDIENIF